MPNNNGTDGQSISIVFWIITLGVVSVLSLSLAIAVSSRVRCVALVAIPTLGTFKGHAIFWILLTKILLFDLTISILENNPKMVDMIECNRHQFKNEMNNVRIELLQMIDEFDRRHEETVLKLYKLKIKSVESQLDSRKEMAQKMAKLFGMRQSHLAFLEPEVRMHNITLNEFDFQNYNNTFVIKRHDTLHFKVWNESIPKTDMHYAKHLTKFAMYLRTFFDVLTPFLWVLLLIYSYRYTSKFLCSLKDNVFVTEQFYRLDKERKMANLKTLLPLHAGECSGAIDLTVMKLSRMETKAVMLSLAVYSASLVVGGLLILFEVFIYQGIQGASKKLNSTFIVSGLTGFEVKLTGNRFSGNMKKLLMREFPEIISGQYTKFNFSTSMDTSKCISELHQPIAHEQSKWILCCCIYVIYLLVALFGSKSRRLQHSIISRFSHRARESAMQLSVHIIAVKTDRAG